MNQTAALKTRIQSIDLLRGLVMIIMALDHVRDMFHYDHNMGHDPLDFSTTWPALFLTRWVTHFCAPVFVFLSGTSVFLYSQKRKTKKEIAFFLFTRGVWLMMAEIFLIDPLWNFNFFNVIVLQVIWAIGLSMVCLSVLQFLPYRILLVIGLLIVGCHNLLDGIHVENSFAASISWSVFHKQHFYQLGAHHLLIIMYPFLPWLGLMILGYCLGKLYLDSTDSKYRKKFLLTTGITMIALFIVIRFINAYGDMHHWSHQKTAIFTILDFINTTKYPPSLLYMLMTIGPALIFIPFAENISNPLSKMITVFGKVPFFYYILHIFLIRSLSWIFFFSSGHSWAQLDFTHFREGQIPEGIGYPLWVVYVVWICVIIILYFPCKWYSRYKETHHQLWLSYV